MKDQLITAITNELSKIFVRKKYIVILVLQIIICIGIGILSASNNNFSIKGFSLDLPNLYFTVLPIFSGIVLPLVIYMLAADLFSNEFENGTIKSVFLRPISRFKIFIAKNMAMIIYIFLDLLIVYMVTLLFRIVVKGNVPSGFSALISYVVTMLPMTAFILVASFVAICINNSSMSVFMNIALLLLLSGLGLAFSKLGAIFFTSYSGFYKIWIGSGMPLKVTLSVSFLLISYCIIFFIIGFLVFDKKEV